MLVLFESVFGVQIPVILHEDDFKIAADQELLQLIFLLSLSHMSQDKLNKLKWQKHKNTKYAVKTLHKWRIISWTPLQ